jgi:hypothetical protein
MNAYVFGFDQTQADRTTGSLYRSLQKISIEAIFCSAFPIENYSKAEFCVKKSCNLSIKPQHGDNP